LICRIAQINCKSEEAKTDSPLTQQGLNKMNAITTNIDLNVLQIKQAIESFPQSEARNDCLGALAQSKETLEKFLDSVLWIRPDYAFDNEEDKKYYQNAGAIEEDLTLKRLIFEDYYPHLK
jgi:hypothetical protein